MPFILVDRILELSPGKNILAEKYISAEEDFFEDHFPGFPVVPGVLLTEMMAQAGGKCLDAEKDPRGKAMLAQIRSASFRDWVGPDSRILIRAAIKTNRTAFATADCEVEVDGRKVASAELFFTFVPADQFSPDYVDRVLEEYLKRR